MSTRNTAWVDFPLYLLSQTMASTAHSAQSQKPPGRLFMIIDTTLPFALILGPKTLLPFKLVKISTTVFSLIIPSICCLKCGDCSSPRGLSPESRPPQVPGPRSSAHRTAARLGFLPARPRPVFPPQRGPFFLEWLHLETTFPTLLHRRCRHLSVHPLLPHLSLLRAFSQISLLLSPSHLFPIHQRWEGASDYNYAQFPLSVRGGFHCVLFWHPRNCSDSRPLLLEN